MTLVATWQRDGTHGALRDEDDGLWGTLRLVDDWHMPGDREPIRAWVIEWLDRSEDESQLRHARVDVAAEPAADEDTMARLSETGAAVARTARPIEPEPFGRAETGFTRGGDVHRRVELISLAIQEAKGRLDKVAPITDPWGVDLVMIALTEALGWIRTLDDTMKHVWRTLGNEARVEITTRIDDVLERPGWDPKFVSWAKTQRDEAGYDDWTLGLLLRSTGLPREDLRGMRWLAGKLLHFGPLPAVELRQWREGEAPRWKWGPSEEIYPLKDRERRSHDRMAYDRYLAGRDLIGSFGHLFNVLHAAEFLAWDLTGRPEG